MEFRLRDKIFHVKTTIKNNKKERNRLFILFLGFLFILDYLIFCFYTEKNIFDIFPPIPLLEEKKIINVYLPSIDGVTILKERRAIPIFINEERFARFLFNIVVQGSVFENTRIAVPVDLFIRNIWIYENKGEKPNKRDIYCIIDLEPPILDENSRKLTGSEALFKKALEKTIMENIPVVNRIFLLERGIPEKILWDL